MTLIEIPDAVHAFLGACGSALSMLWIEETTAFRRLVLFLGGTVFSYTAQDVDAGGASIGSPQTATYSPVAATFPATSGITVGPA